jgi:hypothetical protein
MCMFNQLKIINRKYVKKFDGNVVVVVQKKKIQELRKIIYKISSCLQALGKLGLYPVIIQVRNH